MATRAARNVVAGVLGEEMEAEVSFSQQPPGTKL